MTTTDVTTTDNSLDAQWRYALAVTNVPERGATSLLPKAYQGNPANVLIAMGLGQAIGITPAQALYEIYVVNGRPSPSANLMAALVRRAGHKLRIKGDAKTCTATLIRADDPDEPFEATWTFEQARAAGLTGKDTWKFYPAAMLRARAIAEVVRMGASEAVIGMDYSAEEMRDVEETKAPTTVRATGTDALRAAVTPETADPVQDITDAEVVDEPTDPMQGGETFPAEQNRLAAMFAEFGRAGFTTDARSAEGRQARLDYCTNVLGREVASSKDMSAGEVERVIDSLKVDAADREAQA